MTNLVNAGLGPSSTAATDAERLAAVAAPVHDPLWMLARQYQTGALVAEDGGPPVTVTMRHAAAPLVVAGQPVTGQLEPMVEAEPAPGPNQLDTATKVRLATELFRLLDDAAVAGADVAQIRDRLALAYPLATRGETGAVAAYAGRLPDAAAMLGAWPSSANLPAIPGLSAPLQAALDAPARAWVSWVAARVGDSDSVTPATWEPEGLTYRFDAGAAAVALTADDYDGAGVDWHSFDRAPLTTAPAAGPDTVVRPTRVSYPGMPEPGFWTIEDGNVNLDALAARDPARALLVAFAQGYANDWFLVPLTVAPGVVLVTELTVVDTFGTSTTVQTTASVDGAASRFRLWEVGLTAAGADQGAGMRVLPPSSPPPLEGRPVEDVVLARDELANLGWLIELTTSDGDGERVDRYRRWLAARPESAAPSAASVPAYRLGTTLPDHWYPLEAAEVGPDGHRRLRLAALPDGASEVSDSGVRGRTVDHAAGTAVDEEAASRAGTRVTRVDRLAYTPGGYVVWRARVSGAGTGEATSGLRFDVVES